jgi:tetratricopeptide (TPR) repeat protein
MRHQDDPSGPTAGASDPGEGSAGSFFASPSELLGDQEEAAAPGPSGFFASESELLDEGDEVAALEASGFFASPSDLLDDGAPDVGERFGGPASGAAAPESVAATAGGGSPPPGPGGPAASLSDDRASQNDLLHVSVVHGNLSFARHPLAVGHYAGDTINGAERRVDDQVDGRLSERRQLGLYPGQVGTSSVFLPDAAGLPGVIVVGLGDVGTLTAARLERSFTQGMLAYAAAVAERDGGPSESAPRGVAVATLLVGSGRGGIGVEDSVRALLRGALAARRTLEASTLGRRVRIERLEFMELYEDLAIRIARLLRRLQEEGRTSGQFHLADGLTSGTGGRRRASFGDEDGWWDRLVVRSDGGRMVFQTPTQRAREEERTVPQQQRLVNEFIASAVQDHGTDTSIPNALFELLLPNDLKDYEPDRNDLVMVVDRETARLPWELLRNGIDGEEPIAVRRGLIRQFSTTQFRRNVAPPQTDGVLIIADPPTTRFKSLDGARREAEAVNALFQSRGRTPRCLIGERFDRIVSSLFAEPWRILHLAAHGVVDHVTPQERAQAEREGRPPARVTGVVLADDVFLKPGEVEQIRHVPEVVFINCCHVGAIDPERGGAPELAASLSEQFIRIGVRAVVCAGWAVEDEAAVTFARTFYERMLTGDPFGRAVHAARQATFRDHPGVNTWGAYQCYGDHGYVLERPRDVPYAGRSDLGFTCPSEAVADLENLAGDTETTSWFGLGEMRGRLRELERAVLPRWKQEPAVRAALSLAAARVGLFRKAIGHYRRLERLDKARYPLDAVEQLANLESRYAAVLWRQRRDRGEPLRTERAQARIRRALERLESLPGREYMSSERWSLIGSAYKRLTQLEDAPENRIRQLTAMARSYRMAHRVARKRRKRVAPYPLRNWLAARLMLHILRGGKIPCPDARFLRLMGEADAQGPREDGDLPSFWSGVELADGRLVRFLADGTLPDRAGDVLDGYRRGWQRGGSPLSLNSVVEHIDWMVDMLAPADGGPGPAPAPAPAPLVEALQGLRDRVFLDVALEQRPGSTSDR